MKTLHTSGRYTAYQTKAGLIVQSAHKSGGVFLPAQHPQFAEYVEAIATAIDAAEADALCKALTH